MTFDTQTPLRQALSQDFTDEVISAIESEKTYTLEELYERIAHAGGNWYMSVTGIDRKTAVALVNWLKANVPEIGEFTKRFYPTEDSRQLTLAEKKTSCSIFGSLPAVLSGEFGTNRTTETAGISAQNDFEAIQAWLNARAVNSNTHAQYKKEAERFLLWITMERLTALSSATVDDASAYLRWIEQLGRTAPSDWQSQWRLPQETWIGLKNAPRLSPEWRPFNGPLSPSSRKVASTAVRLLFNFLVKTGYIKRNPFDQVPSKIHLLPGEGMPKAFADRSLTPRQWEAVLNHLDSMPESTAKSRLRVILFLGKGLGMRASEMINAKTGWIVDRRIGDDNLTVIEIIGKGDKVRRLPLSEDSQRAIDRYLARRRLGNFRTCPKDTPILSSLFSQRKNTSGGISRSGLYKTLENFFFAVASEIEKKNPADAEKLRAGSTHWLRHTFAMTALKNMDINIVQTAMGHASIGTTSRYLTPEEAELAQAMKKMKPL